MVLITGASSGIGAATAVAFARAGARLELGARRLDKLNDVAQKCRQAGAPEVMVHLVDVGQRASAKAFIGAAIRDFERIDVLVNNAGVGWFGLAHKMPEEKLDELVATNFKGVVHTTQAVLPWMLERHRGVIVNVSSVAGFRPSPYSAVYGATKHAVVGFSHALRGELSGTGVKVSVVYPGVVAETEFFADHKPAPGPRYSADRVANLIVRMARRPRRDAIVFPMRLVHMAEPIVGGLMDHAIGEARRRDLKSDEGAPTTRPKPRSPRA